MLPLRSRFALPLAALSVAVAPETATAQAPPRQQAEVVVTATLSPEAADSLGAAVTVIDEAEIARSRASSLLELLRSVPGLDLVQSGGPGKLASIFLRGTNSVQTLVLLDGVRLNSPYFGTADISALDLSNVARIEVVRGPFSALFGSDAVGGVVQVFTKRAQQPGLNGSLQAAAGTAKTREGQASIAFADGPIGVTAGFRRLTTQGDLPNDFFAVTNVSGAVDVALSDASRVGLVLRRDEARAGVPFSGSLDTPNRTTTIETTTVSLPVSLALSDRTAVEAHVTFVKDRPGFFDPDDPYGFTFARTDAERVGGRLVLTQVAGVHRLSLGADWERALVFNEDSYGVELDERSTRTWSVFAEDRVGLLKDRLVAAVGVRLDDHSAFGSQVDPRVSLAFRVTDTLRLRASAGRAFRSPTVGELYYPFSGNTALEPERSTSYEVGAELAVLGPDGPKAAAGLVLEATVFRNDIEDLIQYDFASSTNQNVGRARTEGVEVVARGELGVSRVRASYTFLRAEDLDTSRDLLRRPRHRASLTLGTPIGKSLDTELTALFVGRRADVDARTFARVETPSYVRLDAAGTLKNLLGPFSPFVRVTNVLGRPYVEVAGFPSPGRRWLAGLHVGF